MFQDIVCNMPLYFLTLKNHRLSGNHCISCTHYTDHGRYTVNDFHSGRLDLGHS